MFRPYFSCIFILFFCFDILHIHATPALDDDEDFYVDRTGYVDPTDPYELDQSDRTTRTRLPNQKTVVHSQSLGITQEFKGASRRLTCKNPSAVWKTRYMHIHRRFTASQTINRDQMCPASSGVKSSQPHVIEYNYFKQYVNSLLKRRNFLSEASGYGYATYSADIYLSLDDVEALLLFANSDDIRIQEVHSVLVGMLSNIRPVNITAYESTGLKDFFEGKISVVLQIGHVIALFLVCILIHSYIRLPWSTLLFYMLFVAFIISIPWNWFHLYKVAVSVKHAESLKSVPSHCLHGNQHSTWDAFKAWFRESFSLSSDPCQKYYEAIMVDPWQEVPPTKAIAVTITKFLVEPLEIIATSVGKAFRNLFSEVPFHLWPFVFILSIVSVFLFFLMLFRYRIWSPLLRLEASAHEPVTGNSSAADPNRRIQELVVERDLYRNELETLRQSSTNGLEQTSPHTAITTTSATTTSSAENHIADVQAIEENVPNKMQELEAELKLYRDRHQKLENKIQEIVNSSSTTPLEIKVSDGSGDKAAADVVADKLLTDDVLNLLNNKENTEPCSELKPTEKITSFSAENRNSPSRKRPHRTNRFDDDDLKLKPKHD